MSAPGQFLLALDIVKGLPWLMRDIKILPTPVPTTAVSARNLDPKRSSILAAGLRSRLPDPGRPWAHTCSQHLGTNDWPSPTFGRVVDRH